MCAIWSDNGEKGQTKAQLTRQFSMLTCEDGAAAGFPSPKHAVLPAPDRPVEVCRAKGNNAVVAICKLVPALVA